MEHRLRSTHPLFVTPLLRFEVADAARLNAALLDEIAVRRAAEEGVTRSNRNGWHSANDLFRRTEPAHRELAGGLRAMLAEATRKIDPQAEFEPGEMRCDGWVNVNPRGAYNSPHDHMGNFWSGTYYVQVPKGEGDSGAIEFISPRPPLPGGGVVHGDLTFDKARMTPKPGMALIFPASALHWVHPNASDEDRVTIAFNASFRRKRG